MALSIVQICNLALARIGVTDGIADLSDNTAEARACLLARRIDQDGAFEIAGDSSGRLLYANADTVTLSYTARIDDVGLIPHQVAMALAWRMAVELAPALAKTESAADRAQVNYQRALATAMHTCLNEPKKAASADAEAVSAREA